LQGQRLLPIIIKGKVFYPPSLKKHAKITLTSKDICIFAHEQRPFSEAARLHHTGITDNSVQEESKTESIQRLRIVVI
jgi:hypothetical protein